MKILLVQDWLRNGGTERQTVLLARAFAAAGHTPLLLTFRPGGRLAEGAASLVSARNEAAGHTFPLRALQPFDFHLDWFAPGLLRAARQFLPEIVLGMGRMANCHGGRLQKALPGAAVIATFRTGKAVPWLFRRSLHRVRHVIANSEDARHVLELRYNVPAAKISVIHNALVFPPKANPSERPALRSRFGAGPKPDATILLCAAMFRPEKNQRELIEIAAGLPPEPAWELWLAGDGPERRACAALARRLGLAGRVRFLGFQPDLAPVYAAADIAVHASGTESLSNFIIEAQAHGLPAVVHEAQGIRECVLPGRTGWIIPPGDRAAFRAALTNLIIEPPAARQTRACEAAQFARANFDPARQVAQYLDLFRELRA